MIFTAIKCLTLVTVLGLFTGSTYASDMAKEKRWADQITDTLMVGDTVWLNADEHKFLGIYTENSSANEAGAVIIMHGIGIHPNWDTIVHPLRSELPESGWHTLSIQMPVLHNEAAFKDYIPLFSEVRPRIEAAIAFLKGKGAKIVLIGHSLGVSMGAYYMSGKADDVVAAYVAIGASGGGSSEVDYLKSLGKIRQPVLEIFGSNDLHQVVNTQTHKAKIATEKGMKDYKQIKIPGADHFFAGKNDVLVKTVEEWIARFADKK